MGILHLFISVLEVHVLIPCRKGKLRRQDPINLGKQYSGSRISREALEAESDDDPFKAHSSEEDDEDEGYSDQESTDHEDESEQEIYSDSSLEDEEDAFTKPKNAKKQPHRRNAASDEEDESDEDMESDGSDELVDEDEDEDDDVDEESSEEEEEDDDDDGPSKPKSSKSDDREELRRLMASDQKTIAASISQAAKADATKGKAVKQQRSTFDALLNTRIKLQKGLIAINELPVAAGDAQDVDEEAIKSAESAALALWSTLEDLRIALADAQTKDGSKKRKRHSPISQTTSTASLWERMADLESESAPRRRAILDKWSVKVRGTAASLPNARGKLLGSSASGQQTITTVLDAQIATETGERAAKRSRKETKSNGTIGQSQNDDEVEPVYEDTIFYQSLLRDLVEQRMSSSDAITNGLDTLHLNLPSSRLSVHPVTGMRNDKVKKPVDTRASKGRKMRYHVHEKLQNFMAPEDRGTWTKRARDEFFASLLGKTASGLLREDDSSAAEESDEDQEEGGLRLFRN